MPKSALLLYDGRGCQREAVFYTALSRVQNLQQLRLPLLDYEDMRRMVRACPYSLSLARRLRRKKRKRS